MWLLLPILFYAVIYLYIRHVYSHWERKGFPSESAGLSLNFLKSVYKREFNYVEAVSEAYHAGCDHLLFGIYFFFRPTLLVRDVKLARTILESSSGHFNHTKWDYVKDYRKINLLEKLAPIFTPTRVEGMFRNIEKVGDHMIKYVLNLTQDRETVIIDLQDIVRVYSMNAIGNLIYGLDINNFEQTDCIFTNYINNSLRGHINSFTLNHLPKRSSLTYRLRDIIKESVESREEGGSIRKDVLQLLVKFRNGNDIGAGSGGGVKQNWHIENVFGREKFLSIKKLSKIAEELLGMSVETCASAVVLTLYELLQAPNILSKVLDEIRNMKDSIEIETANLSYAELSNLSYLDLCMQETLRLYPGVPVIERVCHKNFSIPASRFMIREGKTIMIPLMAIQRDPKYYEEPLIYKPERFLKTIKPDGKPKMNFIGFGFGPATCVAHSFAKCVIKVAIVKLLQNFNMEMLDRDLEISHRPTPFITSKNGFKVKLKKREIKTKFYL